MTNATATHLSIFVAGYALDTPSFWFVSNGEVPDGSSTTLPLEFESVDDLGGRFVGVNARSGEGLSELIMRTQPSFAGCPHRSENLHAFTALIRSQVRPLTPPRSDAASRGASFVLSSDDTEPRRGYSWLQL